MAKIKNISYAGKQDVYTLTVNKYHNYSICGGIISKNCDALRYAVFTHFATGVGGLLAWLKKKAEVSN